MAKVKTAFFCKHCGTQYSKWQGQCHACKEWNTIVEEVLQKQKTETWQAPNNSQASVPIPLAEVSESQQARLVTGDAELDRVLGGGVVPGSLVLVGGRTRGRQVHLTSTTRSAGQLPYTIYLWRREFNTNQVEK